MIVLASCRCSRSAFSDYFCAVFARVILNNRGMRNQNMVTTKTSTEKCVVIDLQTWNFNICNYFTASSNFQILKREDNYHLWKLFFDMIFRNIHVMLKVVKKVCKKLSEHMWIKTNIYSNSETKISTFWYMVYLIFIEKRKNFVWLRCSYTKIFGKKWVREEIII